MEENNIPNKNKKIGRYLTLKEARKAMRAMAIPNLTGFKEGSYMSPRPIYLEHDGSYSILKPMKNDAVIVEYVDIQSGRRFVKKKIQGQFYYIPKKKAQGFDKIIISH